MSPPSTWVRRCRWTGIVRRYLSALVLSVDLAAGGPLMASRRRSLAQGRGSALTRQIGRFRRGSGSFGGNGLRERRFKAPYFPGG